VRKQRELAARQRRQAVLLQRVRALEVERNAYHRAGVEFPHEELLAHARANALAAGAYGPPGGDSYRGGGRRTDEDLPPYTPANGVQPGDLPANSQRGQPFDGRGMSDGEVHTHTTNTRADRRAASQVGASAAGGAVAGALLGMCFLCIC
jgi:hypothetical protein